MTTIVILIIVSTLFASSIILYKYMDFARFLIERKDKKVEKKLNSNIFRNITYDRFDRFENENIIIDVEVEEINPVRRENRFVQRYLK
jgi:hypothetical protein